MIYLIGSDYKNSFKKGNTVVHSDIPDTDKAYMQVFKVLDIDLNNATGDEVVIKEYTPPKPFIVISFMVDRNSKKLVEDTVEYHISALATDQYGKVYDVTFSDNVKDKVVTVDSVGETVVTASVGKVKKSITLYTTEYIETEEIEELSIEDILLEQEERITALEIGGM